MASISNNSPLISAPDTGYSEPPQDRDGATPLHVACAGNVEKTVIELLKTNADVNAQDGDGRTPLHLACAKGDAKMVKQLIGVGIAHASLKIRDEKGCTPLHYACSRGGSRLVGLLLFAGADASVNVRDKHGKTPLHVACAKGKAKVVGLLKDAGADPYIRDKGGKTPLLLAHAKKITEEFSGVRAAEAPKSSGEIDCQNADGETALHLAFAAADITRIRRLLDAGADVTIRDIWGTPPAHCMFESEDLSVEQRSEILQVICDTPSNLLDEQGSPIPLIDLQDSRGRTLLHFACMADDPKWVKVLLEKGARVDLREKEGKTPLHMVFEHSKDPAKIIEVFSETETGVNAQDQHGQTPLYFACSKDKLEWVEPLLRADAGASFILQEEDGRTPLHLECSKGNTEMVKRLLEAGANKAELTDKNGTSFVDLRDKNGKTPLHYACANDNGEMVRLLLEAGAEASVNIQETEHGRTPLHYACANDNGEMVRLLLEAGAEASVDIQETKDGRTPLHFAFAAGNAEIIQRLIFDAGASAEVQDHSGMLPSHCMLPTIRVLESQTPSPEQFAEVLQVISKIEGLIDLRNGRGSTLLHIACMHVLNATNRYTETKNFKRIAHLLAAGASMDIESKYFDIKRFLNKNPQVIPMSEGQIDPQGKSEEEVPS